MDLLGLKQSQLQTSLGLDPEKFTKPVSFIDFANVNRWFDNDTIDFDERPLPVGSVVEVELKKLKKFTNMIGTDARFYYGHDSSRGGSLAFIKAAEYTFGKHRVFTKPIQQIRHDLTPVDSITNTRIVHHDGAKDFVYIPKCNFDVEMAIDAVRLMENYDTICLFSGDADFAALLAYLKRRGKKVVLIKSGHIAGTLRKHTDLVINASQIRTEIAYVKSESPAVTPGSRG